MSLFNERGLIRLMLDGCADDAYDVVEALSDDRERFPSGLWIVDVFEVDADQALYMIVCRDGVRGSRRFVTWLADESGECDGLVHAPVEVDVLPGSCASCDGHVSPSLAHALLPVSLGERSGMERDAAVEGWCVRTVAESDR